MNNCIEEMVRLGEDSVLEVKSIRIPGKHVVEPDAKDIADEIAAVANSSGATFFFGVNDKTHEVEGIPLEKLDIAETWVRNLCNDAVKPAVVATIRKVAVCDYYGRNYGRKEGCNYGRRSKKPGGYGKNYGRNPGIDTKDAANANERDGRSLWNYRGWHILAYKAIAGERDVAPHRTQEGRALGGCGEVIGHGTCRTCRCV